MSSDWQKKLVQEQQYALAQGGVTHMMAWDTQSGHQNIGVVPMDSIHALNVISKCVLCSLCQTTSKIHVDKVPELGVKYFIVSDFAEANECPHFYAAGSSHHVIHSLVQSLVQKLGWQESQIYRSFALKCESTNGLPPESLMQCRKNLERELQVLKPEVILLFGHHAQKSFANTAMDAPNSGLWTTQSTPSHRVFAFPSSLELQAFPAWRRAVWNVLKTVN